MACAAAIVIWSISVQAQTSAGLRLSVPEIPSVLDPHLASTPLEVSLAGELFMGLVSHTASGEIAPGLAESWEISPDGLTYTFIIGNSARWSDGRRIGPDDFIAGFARALDPKTAAPYAGRLSVIKGAAEVLSGKRSTDSLAVSSLPFRRLQIQLSRPSRLFLENLSKPVAAPVPRHVMDRAGTAWASPEHIVTSGAFEVETSAGEFSLVKNKEFFSAAAVDIESIEFVLASNAENAVRMVENGEAHITLGFPLEVLGGPTSLTVRTDGGHGLYGVAVNVQRPVLKAREVRHALAMTIDRDAVIRDLHAAGVNAAQKFVPPALLGEAMSPSSPYAALRPDMRAPIAEVLLAESRVSSLSPKMFELIYPAGELHAALATQLAQAWAPLGIMVTPEELSEQDHHRRLAARNFDMALSYWPDEGGGALNYLERFSSLAGPDNKAGYAEEDFDTRFMAADAALNAENHPALLGAAEGVIIQDQPVLPVFFYTARHAVHERVGGWVANAAGVHPLRFLSLKEKE